MSHRFLTSCLLFRGVLRGLAPGGALALLLASGSVQGADAPPALSAELRKTTVRSDRLEARNTGAEGNYVFIDNVRIVGTNLQIECDRLEIFTTSQPGVDAAAGEPEESDRIRRILATGNVTINQLGRTATCGQVEILPAENQIILTEDPVVTDIEMGITMKGTRMTYHRGERNIDIENPEVVGPALPNLGFPTSPNTGTPAPTPPTPAP